MLSCVLILSQLSLVFVLFTLIGYNTNENIKHNELSFFGCRILECVALFEMCLSTRVRLIRKCIINI